MPFVQRAVEPKYLSRTSLSSDGKPLVSDQELQAVTNCTLSNALKQLASLVILANDIFGELRSQLDDIAQRSQTLQGRIGRVGVRIELYDPKKVPVPEGSLSDFAERKDHYKAPQPLRTSLFIAETRPQCVRDLYDAAGKSPSSGGQSLNSLRQQTRSSGEFLLCTPILGAKRRRLRQKIDVDIETRIPAVVADLRKWTSTEAIGEVTALTDASTRIAANITLAIPEDAVDCNGYTSGDDEPIDHTLPSPEEQFQVIISKFAPELVPIDTSGKFFDRMCNSRRSLLHVEMGNDQNKENIDSETIKRRTRPRKARGKRRNTISGTDQKELREAIAGDATNTLDSPESADSGAVMRSHSSDLLKKNPIDPLIKKQSHFNTLKQWGKSRLKMISRSPSDSRDSSKDKLKLDKSNSSINKSTIEDIDDINIYETVTMRRRRNLGKNQEHKILQSRRSDKSLAIAVPLPTTATIPVKLRENSCQRRQRKSENKEEPHSSSGNWSASSESGRTSIGSEITTTTIPPKSTTSAGTSSNSLNMHSHGPPSSIVSRRKFLNTSGSSSVTSDGTLTPDIIHDLHEDIETSSEYSCDTEGYYTSFHMDSGLKTLKEEEILMPSTPLHTTNTLMSSGSQSFTNAENEYELFGKGSTSTTTSSAGTVCTTLMAAGSDKSLVIGPVVPERKSSLSKMNKNRPSHSNSVDNNKSSKTNSTFDRNSTFKSSKSNQNIDNKYTIKIEKLNNNSTRIDTLNIIKDDETLKQTIAIIHSTNDMTSCHNICGTDSPDSGHNTSSSPIDDSVSSPQEKNSCSEQEFSESSDLEGVDRIERLRVKTTINSSRIPSICVITPANSDDESIVNVIQDSQKSKQICESKIISRPKLELPILETDIDTNTTIRKAKNKKDINVSHQDIGYSKVTEVKHSEDKKTTISMKPSLLPLNSFMCKLKGVLPHKLSKKTLSTKEIDVSDKLYSDIGDYVTIADVRNNNKKIDLHQDGGGVYYSNDVVKRNLQAILSGKLKETEYVSLNELPSTISDNREVQSEVKNILNNDDPNMLQRHGGAKVTLDANGKVIYSSDSIRRRKGAHTTFEPGPFVKDKEDNNSKLSPKLSSPKLIRHIPEVKFVDTKIQNSQTTQSSNTSTDDMVQPSQRSKIIIKAANSPHGKSVTEVIKLPPTTIIKATPLQEIIPQEKFNDNNKQTIRNIQTENVLTCPIPQPTVKGAFVNIQESDGVSLSPKKTNQKDYRHSTADMPYLNIQRQSNTNVNLFNQHLEVQSKNANIKNITNTNQNRPMSSLNYFKNMVTPNVTGDHFQYDFHNTSLPISINNYEGISLSPESSRAEKKMSNENTPQYSAAMDSIKISPINPKDNNKHFYSSTPSKESEDNDLFSNLIPKLLSPVKSTMSNEELYAVIHKSKRKMNIKDSQVERAGSPALSSTSSMSPANSENTLPARLPPFRLPETGYLTGPRNRNMTSTNEPTAANSGNNNFNTIDLNQNHEQRQAWAPFQRTAPQIPQTSRMDFKKLLLQRGVKLSSLNPTKPPPKISAVEQLKQSKEKVKNLPVGSCQNISKVNILDLSGSPKTFMNRKTMRNHPPVTPTSPSRLNMLAKEHKVAPKILLSPKQQWRFSSPRSDVVSSPIPEVFNEDDSPNNSNERAKTKVESITISNQNNHYSMFPTRRTLIPTIRENVKESSNETQYKRFEDGITTLAATNISKGVAINDQLQSLLESSQPRTAVSGGSVSRADYIKAQKERFLNQEPLKRSTILTKFSPISVSDGQAFLHIQGNSDANTVTVITNRGTPSPPTLETAL